MVRNLVSFLTRNTQILYSLIVILLIPIALALNTLWLLRSIDRDTSFQLRREALIVGNVISTITADELRDATLLSTKLHRVQTRNDEITSITVAKADPSMAMFPIIASTEATTTAQIDTTLGHLVWSTKTPHAALVLDSKTKTRSWSVVLPVLDNNERGVGIAAVNISASTVDAVIGRTIRDSLIVLGVTLVLILLLLVNHLRFFEYANLFLRLREVDKMKDDFISMASHELKTPLTIIAGYASLLEKNPKIAEDAQNTEDLHRIEESTHRLSELVDDLLNVSRIEQNRLTFELKPLALAPIIDTVVKELQVQADQKHITVHFEPAANQPTILGDENRLKQVFINIIGNAIKYTPAGEVTISQKVEGNLLKTYVKDTGMGMSPENRKHLFEKFYRIRNEKTDKIPGTGLGLWITKQLVERMKGEIFVDSIEGTGSQFTISFPVVA